MIRNSMLVGVVLSVSVLAACDKKAEDDQSKANNAQATANEKVAEAKTEADKKINAAQAEADKKIAEAQASFGKLREDFRHKTTTDLVDLNKKIDELDAKAKKATGKTKADLDTRMPQIKAKRDAFNADFKTIDNVTAPTWDDAKARLEKEWSDLKTMVDKAS